MGGTSGPTRRATRQGRRRGSARRDDWCRRMNTKIRRLAVGLLACYLALFVQLNIIQVGRQQELAEHPRNDRQTLRDFNRPRGPIVTADGRVVARSVQTPAPGAEFEYQREYPLGDLFGNVTG